MTQSPLLFVFPALSADGAVPTGRVLRAMVVEVGGRGGLFEVRKHRFPGLRGPDLDHTGSLALHLLNSGHRSHEPTGQAGTCQ